MKAIYTYTGSNEKIYIPSSGGRQFILVWFESDQDWYVFLADTYRSTVHINKIKNKLLSRNYLFDAENFEALDDDEFDSCYEWLNNNYNYQGLQTEEKITGES